MFRSRNGSILPACLVNQALPLTVALMPARRRSSSSRFFSSSCCRLASSSLTAATVFPLEIRATAAGKAGLFVGLFFMRDPGPPGISRCLSPHPPHRHCQ